MEKKSRKPSPLKLHRETLYAMDAMALQAVAGGATVGPICNTGTCPKTTVLTYTDCPNTVCRACTTTAA